MLSSGLLQRSFKIVKSQADGFCLLHSVSRSLNAQISHCYDLDINKLITCLKGEAMQHIDEYSGFCESISAMIDQMYDYIENKNYDTDFGNVIPLLLANSIEIDICILYRHGDALGCRIVECSKKDANVCVFIYKVGDHYDAVYPISYNHLLIPEIARNVQCSQLCKQPQVVEISTHNDISTLRDKIEINSDKINAPDNDLRLVTWNINGLTQYKLHDNILGNFLKGFDIILLSETWTSEHDEFSLEGFEFHNFPSSYWHVNARRNSGGLPVFIRCNVKHGLLFVKQHDGNVIWFKLRKQVFSLRNDIYLGNVYIVPEGSTHSNNDVFNVIMDDIAKFPLNAKILLCGDYNARTGTESDVITNEVHGTDRGLSELIPDIFVEAEHMNDIPRRYSMDKSPINRHGNQLIERCKSAGIVIFNGRIGTDKGVGEYTRVDTTGCSVVDYMIGSPSLLDRIINFTIVPKFPESDHRPIACSIRCSARPNETEVEHGTNWLSFDKYKWSPSGLDKARTVLCDQQSEGYRSYVIDALASHAETNEVAIAFDQYVRQAIDRTCTKAEINASKRPKGLKWYDRELRLKRSEAIKAGVSKVSSMRTKITNLVCGAFSMLLTEKIKW